MDNCIDSVWSNMGSRPRRRRGGRLHLMAGGGPSRCRLSVTMLASQAFGFLPLLLVAIFFEIDGGQIGISPLHFREGAPETFGGERGGEMCQLTSLAKRAHVSSMDMLLYENACNAHCAEVDRTRHPVNDALSRTTFRLSTLLAPLLSIYGHMHWKDSPHPPSRIQQKTMQMRMKPRTPRMSSLSLCWLPRKLPKSSQTYPTGEEANISSLFLLERLGVSV